MKQLFLILILIPSIIFGQGWEKTFGGSGSDYGHQVQQTADGGFVVIGNIYTPERKNDIYLVKTNLSGDTLWTRTYGGTHSDYGFSVQQTNFGGYILLGELGRNNGNDIYLIKTNENGDTIWTRKYGEIGIRSTGYYVQQTSDGGYVLSGYIHWETGNDVYLIKTDSYGDTLWTRTFDNGLHEEGYTISQTSDGGYLIAGTSHVVDYWQSDIYLVKVDKNGNTIWTKTIDHFADDIGCMAVQTNDGGFVIVGATDSTSVNIDHNLLIVKTDMEGNTSWTKTYRLNDNYTVGWCIQQTSDNGYIITGFTDNYNPSNEDIYLMKTNNMGDTLWTKTYVSDGIGYGYYVEQTTDGGYIISGSQQFPQPGHKFDIVLIKTDEHGSVLSTIEIPVPNISRKLIKIIDLSGKEITKPLVNQPYIEVYDDGTTRKKMKIK